MRRYQGERIGYMASSRCGGHSELAKMVYTNCVNQGKSAKMPQESW